ncbi:MAG: hypothetical protein EPO00_02495 [Chloroflexota bacterium]|nr:MAG: hypothetical protein EPO00_02495 [Chloroflexota bacterium]
MAPLDDRFRRNLERILARSGRSRRGLSAAFGRDSGYVTALLDPSRPARARPTPTDLLRASDELGIPFVELLELLWDVPVERLVDELIALGRAAPPDAATRGLTSADRAELAAFRAYLADRAARRQR